MPRYRVSALLVALLPAAPSTGYTQNLLQLFEPPPTPTAAEVPPGVDHGSSEDLLPPEYRKRPVFYRTSQPPGTIIISTPERFLYLVQGNNVAMRYAIGVGRDGYQWGGTLRMATLLPWTR